MIVVVLVVVFGVDVCEIYIDVDGVYLIDFWIFFEV